MSARILIIDDDVVSSKLFQRILEQEGHEVSISNDGKNIVDLVQKNNINIILLDIILPNISGYDLLQNFQTSEDTREIPVIVLTGLSGAENVKKALDLGALDYIRKPCETIELIARVNSALRLKIKQDMLNEFAQRDALTNLYNRRYFNVTIDYLIERKEEYLNGIALLMLDIDHFKNVNDRFGHSVGDGVLSAIANVLSKSVKKSDIACRYGGEEFCLILPDTTIMQSVMVAERIRTNVQKIPFMANDKEFSATVSIGASHAVAMDRKNGAMLINEADAALYEAKNCGRNNTKIFKETTYNKSIKHIS